MAASNFSDLCMSFDCELQTDNLVLEFAQPWLCKTLLEQVPVKDLIVEALHLMTPDQANSCRQWVHDTKYPPLDVPIKVSL